MGKQDVFYFEGLDDILIATMTVRETVSTPPQYGEIVRLPIATKLAIKGNGSELEKWASSKMFRRVSRETKHEIGLDHVGIPIEVMDELKGLISKSGVTFGKNNARELPYFAFGFIGNVEGGGKKAVWYPKTQLSNVVDEEYTTAEEETKIDDVTANLVATGLVNNGIMYASFDSNRDSAIGVPVDTFISTPIFDEKQWEEVVMGKTAPATPTKPTGTIEADGSINLSIGGVIGAQSYIVHYGAANESDPNQAIFMGYSETDTWNLSSEDVPEHSPGDDMYFYVQAYREKGIGNDDIAKAQYLHDGEFTGSAWSKPYMAEFE